MYFYGTNILPICYLANRTDRTIHQSGKLANRKIRYTGRNITSARTVLRGELRSHSLQEIAGGKKNPDREIYADPNMVIKYGSKH